VGVEENKMEECNRFVEGDSVATEEDDENDEGIEP
jgi:hypothetical protein